jgi:S-sulfo-L-cysteine synthase (O-acetyl-L-serine-dependent)
LLFTGQITHDIMIDGTLDNPKFAPPAALIGRTPLVRLTAYETKPGVEIYAKLESRNPGGSVKDRAAWSMVRAGERAGALGRGTTLLDATSGNTGISYAMLGAARGFKVRLCVPANVTVERKRLLAAYGADVVLTDPMDGSDGAIREVRRLYAQDPHRYFYPDQYSNDANWQAHYETTAVEILEQTGGRVTAFVAGLGTSGTFTGTGRRLRAWNRSVRLVSVQPSSPLHGLEGLKHMPTAIVPSIYDPTLADENIDADTEESLALVRRLAREQGLLVGPSSGAALAAAMRLSGDLREGVIVAIFPDGGERYMSDEFWARETSVPAESPAIAVTAPHRLALASGLDQTIGAHGARTFPEECCGALIGPASGQVTEAWALDNTTTLERKRRFLVGPAEYRAAEARADASGRQLLGFYHSHPDHPAVPSAFDLEHALPNLSYVIVSVRKGVAAEMRSWRLRADRSGYDEETIAVGD